MGGQAQGGRGQHEIWLLRPFSGKREAKENAEDFLDDVEFAAEQLTTPAAPDGKMLVRLFRQHLDDKALDFWLEMDAADKKEWTTVKAKFLAEFGGSKALDQMERMVITGRIMAMAQGSKSIAEYVQEAKTLFREVPKELSEMFAICFVKGLSDANKKAAVSFAMREGKIDFKRAVEMVKASYRMIGEPDIFTAPVEKPRRRWRQQRAKQ